MSVSPHDGATGHSGLIIPENIPGDDLKPIHLEIVASTLRGIGTSVRTQAELAETSWSGLPGVLESPEGPTIYAALGTPSDSARTIETKFGKVADALDDYASVMLPIKQTFVQIKNDAVAFRATIRWDEKVWISPRETQEYEHDTKASTSQTRGYMWTADEVTEYLQGRGESTRLSGGRVQILAHWTQSSEHVDDNNALMDRLADAYAKLQNAEADCANAINRQRELCMADVEYIEAWQLKQDGENTVVLPWGSRVDEERNCGESFWWGAGNAGKEALEGAGMLIGRDALSGEFSWETAGQGWTGALAGIGSLVLMTMPPAQILGQLGVPVFKEANEMVTEMGKGLLAWDTWAENPSEAAGRVLVNVGSLFIPGAGEVSAAIKAVTSGSRIAMLAGDVAAHVGDAVLAGLNKVDNLAGQFGHLLADTVGIGSKVDGVTPSWSWLPDSELLHVGAKADTPPPTSLVDDGPFTPRPHSDDPVAPAPHTSNPDTPTTPHGDTDGPATPHADPDNPGTGHGGDGPGTDGPNPDGPNSDGPNPDGPNSDGPTAVPDEPQPRIYTMMDGNPHASTFAPEQLPSSRVTDALLNSHGITRPDFIDLVNKPISSLTGAEMKIINDVRNALPPPALDSVFQKVMDQPYFDANGTLQFGRAESMVLDNVTEVSGSVTFVDDAAHLGTPQALHDNLRLDYPDTHFRPDDSSAFVMRFEVDDPATITPSLHSQMGGGGLQDAWSPPFTGNGFLGAADDIIPEYRADGAAIRNGAEVWEVLPDGTQRLFAVLRDSEWIPQG